MNRQHETTLFHARIQAQGPERQGHAQEDAKYKSNAKTLINEPAGARIANGVI